MTPSRRYPHSVQYDYFGSDFSTPTVRKVRKHNLRYTEDYCRRWRSEEGFREIVQNFLDGICSTFNTSMDNVDFRHAVKGGPGKKEWEETWVAKAKAPGEDDRVFGKIRHDRKRRSITVTNANVTLDEDVLLTGSSSKRNAPNQIGGHGEGMKIGILRLVVANSGVRYRTGSENWKFSLLKEPGSNYRTLRCETSPSNVKRTKRKDLDVFITNIDADKFVLENFLPLSRHLQTPLEASECWDGQLIDSSSQNLASKRVYVKGIFVWENRWLRVSINLARATVNRDREIMMDQGGIRRAMAKIWTETFTNEAKLTNKPFTEKFLGFALNDIDSMEYESMEYMGPDAAARLYDFIVEQTPEAFPFKEGAEEEEKLISLSLQKKPYPVKERFLKLLMKHSDVMTVYEAQEKAFLADSAESLPHIYELPLAKVIRAFVTEVCRTPEEIVIKFHKPSGSSIEALLKEGTLFCSESLVDVHFQNDRDVWLKVLVKIKQELCKGKGEREDNEILIEMMKFVHGADVRSFFPPPPEWQPRMTSPTTPAEASQGDEQEEAPDCCDNSSDFRVTPIGSKRRLDKTVHGGKRIRTSLEQDIGITSSLNDQLDISEAMGVEEENSGNDDSVTMGDNMETSGNDTAGGHDSSGDMAKDVNDAGQGRSRTGVTGSATLESVSSCETPRSPSGQRTLPICGEQHTTRNNAAPGEHRRALGTGGR